MTYFTTVQYCNYKTRTIKQNSIKTFLICVGIRQVTQYFPLADLEYVNV